MQATAKNDWTIQSIKRADAPATPKINVGVYECPKCKASFTSATPAQNSVPVQSVEPTMSILIGRLNEVRSGLKQNLQNLRRNLEVLESERSSVLIEIETVKKDAESKAVGLEMEISQLREDISSLKELLGLNKESS
jgi:hypothetical protein